MWPKSGGGVFSVVDLGLCHSSDEGVAIASRIWIWRYRLLKRGLCRQYDWEKGLSYEGGISFALHCEGVAWSACQMGELNMKIEDNAICSVESC